MRKKSLIAKPLHNERYHGYTITVYQEPVSPKRFNGKGRFAIGNTAYATMKEARNEINNWNAIMP